LAVDDIYVAVTYGASLQRCQVGASTRLAVSDAEVQESPAIEGEIQQITPGPPLKVTGYAIDHRRRGPADAIALSYQETGGQEIWWTPVTGRFIEKALKKRANDQGLEGEHARIGWIWEGGQDSTHYQTVTPPARPCTIRAYVMDGRTGTFYHLAGSLPWPVLP
jgi:hypothetical protein